jgi:UDP:flavonoid glycosyltransferase YjiC (YdhE family)
LSSGPPAGGPARIVLTTFGSLGDLHPFLAIGLGLRARGHEVVVATSETYRDAVARLGLAFRPLRPDLPDPASVPDLMARAMDLRRGTEYVVRRMVLPALRDSYADTLAAAAGADLLLSHPLTYATPIVAEQRGIPWASTVLQPMGMVSAHDPSLLPAVPFLWPARHLGPGVYGALLRSLRWTVRAWHEPVRRLRAEAGLPPTAEPLLDPMRSPHLVLALFSELLAAPQPDWPARTALVGFPFLEGGGSGAGGTGAGGGSAWPADLERFLGDGPPPLVFTLGSSAVLDAGRFYEHSAAAAERLGRRAVLLVGAEERNRPRRLATGVVAADYAAFSRLFPRAAALVHQGGIGTTGEAMRAGRPMLVVPFAHDQPDNAERLRHLGIARVVPRRRYEPRRVADELARLLGDPAYAERAAAVGARVRREDGVGAACDALEALLSARVESQR